ncbi:hypothetical protein RF11_13511 [Thelohanellus kitauei]|uniref:Uncharacterized protein n=1 Tax=Thelohanellus kitauei TaxID=669202 RepID=A0A0C2MSJ0_THEKT|nr:hypothetical protein RF11_13511 [Thelohanellus kitauei]
MDGLERCSEFILQKLDSSELSRSFSSKYYDKGLEELVKYAQKHGIPKLMTKLKYKYLKYLFKEKGIKQALTFYDDVIRKSISWDQFGDWVELRCVCVCILAILRREGIVQISNDDVSKSPQDVENNFQNLSVQRFWECLKKRNIDGLEETVKRLSAKSEDPEAFIEDPVLEHVVEDPCKEQLNQDSGTEQVVKDPVIKLPSY